MRKAINFQLFLAKNWLTMWWSQIRVLVLGINYSETPIPSGVYCYEPDYEKNRLKDKGDYAYYTKHCPYSKYLGNGWNGCQFMGYISDDPTFGDSVKACGVNYNFKDDE